VQEPVIEPPMVVIIDRDDLNARLLGVFMPQDLHRSTLYR
jgi:hypothetical protein